MKVRTTKPESNNKYYISKSKGGWNPCIIVANATGNNGKVDKDLDVLANCTAYATGRFNEALELGECKYLGNKNARDYITLAESQGLTVSKEPVVGGVMVWGGTNQHVEFVESMSADKNICYDTSSGYGLYVWDTRTRKRNSGGANQWGFNKANGPYLGCINPPKATTTTISSSTLTGTLELNGKKYSVTLTEI